MNAHPTLAMSIRAVLAAAALGLGTVAHAQVAGSAAPTPLVQQGQSALDKGDYARAIAAFGEAARAGGSDADAAGYWKAYAEFRAGRPADAKRSIEHFVATWPKSRWMRDARALNVDVDAALGRAPRPDKTADEELKLYALDSLMQMDPKQALPVLQRFMAGQHSTRLKERALFVASQSDLPEAKRLVLGAARDNANPDLQRRAIMVLGSADDPELLKALLEVYRSGAEPRVRRAVLDAWVAADAKAELLAAAKAEADAGIRRHAVHMLGAVDGTAELRQLLATEKDPAIRRAILDGFVAADDEQGILEVARKDADPGVRRHALHMLGAVDAVDELRALYRTEKEPALRRAILEGLVAADDAEGLIEAARQETDPAVKRHAIQMLGAVDHDDDEESRVVNAALFEQMYAAAREPSEKRAVVEALMSRGDAKTLLKLYRAETDPQLKRYLVQMLAHMDDPEAQQVLIDILDK